MRVLIAVLVLSACGPSIPPARLASGSLDDVTWLHAGSGERTQWAKCAETRRVRP